MSDQDRSLPSSVDALLDYLDQTYRNQCPSPKMADREVWMAVGARGVVDHLLRLRDTRDDNLLVRHPPE